MGVRAGIAALTRGTVAGGAGIDVAPSAPCSAALPVRVPMRRTSPAGWRQRPRGLEWHEGLDLVADVGEPVYAVRAGRVALATEDGARGFRGYGRCVVIDHGPTGNYGAAVGLDGARRVWACYAHNDATLVRPGDTVAAGDQIARAGRSSGGAFPGMGAHVHIGTRWAKADGSAPWPGPYPHPVRAPVALARSWIDPEVWLRAFGIVQATDARAASYVVIAGSPADCPGVPRDIVRGLAPQATLAADITDADATPYASGPAAVERAPLTGRVVGVAIGVAVATGLVIWGGKHR